MCAPELPNKPGGQASGYPWISDPETSLPHINLLGHGVCVCVLVCMSLCKYMFFSSHARICACVRACVHVCEKVVFSLLLLFSVFNYVRLFALYEFLNLP